MSNALAIAAVTATVRDRIARALGAGITVTSIAPDRARANASSTFSQVNLFLYQITPNASLRNMDFNAPSVSSTAGGTDRSMPPLALNLHYLLTAYGDADSESDAQQLLGKAMLALNDQPELDAAEIQAATKSGLPNNDLDRQIERVRLSLAPLTTDDYYKLWSGFQTPFRMSVAYEARVVLIDTELPPRTVLPVLTIGPQNQGVDLRAGPGPFLDEVRCISGPAAARGSLELPSARLGDHVLLIGSRLGGSSVRFTPLPPFGSFAATAPPNGGIIESPGVPSPDGITVDLTGDANGAPWIAGVYNVQAVQARGILKPLVSNAVPMRFAPLLSKVSAKGSAKAGTVVVTASFLPALRPEQQATLIVGSQSADAPTKPPRSANVQQLTLPFPDAVATPAGDPSQNAVVRLRVDGVDSVPIDPTAAANGFDPNQQVRIPA